MERPDLPLKILDSYSSCEKFKCKCKLRVSFNVEGNVENCAAVQGNIEI